MFMRVTRSAPTRCAHHWTAIERRVAIGKPSALIVRHRFRLPTSNVLADNSSVLTTARLRLRPWREEDLEPFAALNADPSSRVLPVITDPP